MQRRRRREQRQGAEAALGLQQRNARNGVIKRSSTTTTQRSSTERAMAMGRRKACVQCTDSRQPASAVRVRVRVEWSRVESSEVWVKGHSRECPEGESPMGEASFQFKTGNRVQFSTSLSLKPSEQAHKREAPSSAAKVVGR